MSKFSDRSLQKLTDDLSKDDIVLDHPVLKGEQGTEEKAPEPLLPNFGAARLQEYAGDLNMMVLLDAKERSLAEMLELA